MDQEYFQRIFIQTPAPIVFRFVEPLNTTMRHYEINTLLRQAAFIAQIGHESGGLRYKEEIASGKACDTGKKAIALGNTPEADGDGQRFKGRGLIQITGKTNYLAFARDFAFTLDEAIEYLKTDLGAAMSAGWFWSKRKINALADQEKFETITRRINGGLNGYDERRRLYARAKQILAEV